MGGVPTDAAGKLAAHRARTAHAARGLAADARARLLPTLLHLSAVRAWAPTPTASGWPTRSGNGRCRAAQAPLANQRARRRSMIGLLVTLSRSRDAAPR